jgi:hypothetical protein
LTRYGIVFARGIGTDKSERLPAQKLGGRYKSDSRVQGGFVAGMFPFLTGAGPLEYSLDRRLIQGRKFQLDTNKG